MTDLEIFAEWHEKSLGKYIIKKNAQVGVVIEFAKYYHKKQLTLTDIAVSKGTLCDDCKELKKDTITLCKECYLND